MKEKQNKMGLKFSCSDISQLWSSGLIISLCSRGSFVIRKFRGPFLALSFSVFINMIRLLALFSVFKLLGHVVP